jgi:CheY-like chemotaxis protein
LSAGDRQALGETRSMMERQLDQMVRLVDDLLDVSRISRNRLGLRRQETELSSIIHSAVETSRPLIDQLDHTLALTLPPESVYLHADAARLAQVFSNLLNNSAKYTDRSGHVWLIVERQGNEVLVRIRDSGIGIPAERLNSVFDMFSQIDGHPERAQGGLGIGLTLVKRLVEMHGGSVSAHSAGLGKGSEFTVRLPVLRASERATASPAAAPLDSTNNKRRILVVDDNQDAATSLSLMLKMLGNDTRTAHDGLQAVEAAAEFRPDVIFLDIGMPKLNGYDACRRIRKLPGSEATLIVALTGWGQDEDRRRSRDAGFNQHLVKPVDLAALASVLAAPALRESDPSEA